MKKTIIALFSFAVALSACSSDTVTMSKEELLDKIKGGWAGQTFACTYGGPTEFKYNGRIIEDTVNIPWPESHVKWYYENSPGLYDDVYMDLSFVDVIDKHGVDAPVELFAEAFANAEYNLWHANQAARYNILNGISAPASGHWKNNPHADDLDFQIEADFAGLMNPGMPLAAEEISDKVGHIMCYGDGYYGGLYVAVMYSLAFIYDDPAMVVKEALKSIPAESDYYKCISDVITWCEENADWKKTWCLIEDKWANEISCPKGIDDPFNIDAKVNSAYVVMGLLYGAGDMDRTIEVSTRCGADSDCNPATAAGILGTILGYSNISDKWISQIKEVEDMDFAHTEISLNETYGMGFRHALASIERNGGKIDGDNVTIKVQTPRPAKFEKSFEGLALVNKDKTKCKNLKKAWTCSFEGNAIVMDGQVNRKADCPADYVAELEVIIDGKKEIVTMPAAFATRKFDIYWNYGLPQGKHEISVQWLNPEPFCNVVLLSTTVYTEAE